MDINNYRAKYTIETEELLNLKTVETNDIYELLHMARDLKLKVRLGERWKKLAGKTIFSMVKHSFGKSRLAYEVAARSLDAYPISLQMVGSDIEQLVSDPDYVKVINRFGFSLAVVDTSERNDSLNLAKNMNLPVINANDGQGACHSLAVLLTIWERKNKLSGLKAVIVGDFDQDQTSLLYGMVKCGIEVTVVAPGRFATIQRALERAKPYGDAKWSGDLDDALTGCDVVVSFEHDFGEDYMVTYEKLSRLAPGAVYMQNIPLTRGKEADNALLDSQMSAIYDLGENIVHAERAAIYLLSK